MTDEPKKITKKELDAAKAVIKEFLDKLELDVDVAVELNDESIEVVLETVESGIIIGYHGETLESLQLLLSLAVSKKIGRFVRVMVDVGGYKQQRTEYLEQLVSQLKEAVISENREKVVNSLKSWERRVVHMILKDDPDVVTESEGAGRDRVLVIKPK